jgi:hypothetical protein
MAIFHSHIQNISKGSGRSVIAASCYRSAGLMTEKILDQESGLIIEMKYDYRNKKGVVSFVKYISKFSKKGDEFFVEGFGRKAS